MRSTAWTSPAVSRIASLLEIDPDLGRTLPPERRPAAERSLPVRVVPLRRGPWAVDKYRAAPPGHLGVLIVEGLVGRELLADDAASMELLGPGDVLRPWDEAADSELLEAAVRWSALAPSSLAVLDHQVAIRLADHPEIMAALMQRFAWRTRRLAVLQSIAQLNRVDRRVLAVLWHLAERWGRMGPDGVMLPLALSHRMLGQLVGARRPTVSSAIGELTRDGRLIRGPRGTWILPGPPVGAPDARTSGFTAPRRAVLAPQRETAAVG